MATVSSYMPDVVVEVAFDSGFTTPAVSRTWTDVSDYVEATEKIQVTRGRPDQFANVQPSRMTVTLDNRDGRFTPENAAGAYYPNVKKGRPIRTRVTVQGNALSANDASFETSVAGWTGVTATLSQSAVRAVYGTKSMLVNVTTADGYARAGSGMSAGTTYTFSAYVYVPSGGPNVYLEVQGKGSSVVMTTKDAWVRVSVTVAATGGHLLAIHGVTTGSFYVDGVMVNEGSTALDFTTTPTTTYTRFTGYVDEWPVVWPDGTDSQSTVTVTATSRMARLARTAEFKPIVEEEYLDDDPVLYFPLGEPSGTTTAGNFAPGRSEVLSIGQAGTGGTLAFGTATGPGTDGLSAPTFTPVDPQNGVYLSTRVGSDMVPSGAIFLALEAWFSTTYTGTGPDYVAQLTTNQGLTNSGQTLYIGTDGGGLLAAGFIGLGVGGAYNATSVADGLVHHAVVLVTFSGTNVSTQVMLDGSVIASYGPSAWTNVTGGVPSFLTPTRLLVGAGAFPGALGDRSVWPGAISHVAAYAGSAVTTARFAQHYAAGATGFTTDASGARIQRYARLAGVPSAEVSTETGLSTSIAHKDTTGESPLSLMQAVTQTEDGVLFDGVDGTLTFQARSHRYGSTSAFTLDRNAGDIEEGFNPTLDDQHLSNDVTASRPNGVSIRSTNAASVAEYGYYRETVEVLTTSDNEVQSRADWQVNRFGTPRVTVPNVGVDLLTSPNLRNLLAADIGTRITLANLPSQAPATSQDYFIEGITETFGNEEWKISFNTSAASYADVWQLDSASFSQLDSTTVLAY